MNLSRTDDGLRTDLRDWLRTYLAGELGLPPGSVDPEEPMSAYGLDSVKAITILADVEELIGLEIDPNALWEYPTVASFSGLLADRLAENGRAPLA